MEIRYGVRSESQTALENNVDVSMASESNRFQNFCQRGLDNYGIYSHNLCASTFKQEILGEKN
jgi:hypothetical protein